MELIFSGYGAKPSNNLALYSIEHNNTKKIKWQTSIEDPSFVCEGDGYLFTITEASDHAYVYILKRIEDGYELLDQKIIEGGALCHITYSSKNKALFGACYETGTVFSVQVENGRFGEMLYHVVQRGEDPKAISRAHCVLLNRDETKLITINIVLDRVYIYNCEDGHLTLSEVLYLPKGIGPRHALFSEDEKLIYIITEYSNEILIFKNTDKKLLQRISTLDKDFTGTSNCSTLCFSKDGRYLYAANRGAQTITLFQVTEDGTLVWMKEFDCGGEHPRHMIITRDGRSLAVCNQLSDNITIFELDTIKGDLVKTIANIPFSSPSGILEPVFQ